MEYMVNNVYFLQTGTQLKVGLDSVPLFQLTVLLTFWIAVDFGPFGSQMTFWIAVAVEANLKKK